MVDLLTRSLAETDPAVREAISAELDGSGEGLRVQLRARAVSDIEPVCSARLKAG